MHDLNEFLDSDQIFSIFLSVIFFLLLYTWKNRSPISFKLNEILYQHNSDMLYCLTILCEIKLEIKAVQVVKKFQTSHLSANF